MVPTIKGWSGTVHENRVEGGCNLQLYSLRGPGIPYLYKNISSHLIRCWILFSDRYTALILVITHLKRLLASLQSMVYFVGCCARRNAARSSSKVWKDTKSMHFSRLYWHHGTRTEIADSRGIMENPNPLLSSSQGCLRIAVCFNLQPKYILNDELCRSRHTFDDPSLDMIYTWVFSTFSLKLDAIIMGKEWFTWSQTKP